MDGQAEPELAADGRGGGSRRRGTSPIRDRRYRHRRCRDHARRSPSRLHLAAADGDLFGVRMRERERRTLRLHLLFQRVDPRLGGVKRGPRLVERLRRVDALLRRLRVRSNTSFAFSRSAVAAICCASAEASVDSACLI